MSSWSSRSSLYKWTLVFLYFMFLVYGLAFSVPTWFGDTETVTVTGGAASRAPYFQGLWMVCTDVSDDVDFDSCKVRSFGDEAGAAGEHADSSDWMDGVRGVWVAGAAFYLLAVLISFGDNCCCGSENGKDHGVAAIWALIAGLDGAAGVIVVAVKTSDKDTLNNYRWGYFLACTSSGLTIILSIMLFLTRNVRPGTEKSRASRTADYVYNSGKAGGPQYNGGYHHDNIPMQNGGPHPHPHQQQYSMYRGEPRQPSAPGYHGNSLPHPRHQGSGGYSGPGYTPFGGYDMGRANNRTSMAESADLSNGYTTELINAEHSLSRSHRGDNGGYGNSRHQGDFYHNGRY